MTPPTTYRIVPGEAVDYLPGKTWAYHAACKDWSKMGGPLAYFPGETHYCHSEKRPTHDPTAPATPATSAAKGGDIPRTPTDSEMLDWLENAQFTYHVLIQSQPHGDVMHDRTPFAGSVRAAIAAEMMKKA